MLNRNIIPHKYDWNNIYYGVKTVNNDAAYETLKFYSEIRRYHSFFFGEIVKNPCYSYSCRELAIFQELCFKKSSVRNVILYSTWIPLNFSQ